MLEEPEVGTLASRLSSRWQYILDKIIPHTAARWISFSLCLYVYILRVYFLNGWYIVTYALGIYLSNQILGFIQPQFDPDDAGPDLVLPVSNMDEFRPFARKLPEFKFWCSCIQAVVISFFMTFFTALDIPVFWPALLIYFLALFFIQMKQQIKHMIKHRYVPFSWGKTKYATGGATSKGSGKQNL